MRESFASWELRNSAVLLTFEKGLREKLRVNDLA
jgi:hypothetical protein